MQKATQQLRAVKVPHIVKALTSLPDGEHTFTTDEFAQRVGKKTITKRFIGLTINTIGKDCGVSRLNYSRVRIRMNSLYRDLLKTRAEKYINGTFPE